MYAKNSIDEVDEVMGKGALQCCSRAAELLVFTKWVERGLKKPLLEVVLYMCCLHYEGKNYRKVCIILSVSKRKVRLVQNHIS